MGLRLTHKEIKELNNAVMVVAIVEPLTTLPQIIKVFTTKSVAGVSIWTWFLYLVAEFIWLIYGLAIKNRPVIVTNFLWILMDSAVVIGVLVNTR